MRSPVIKVEQVSKTFKYWHQRPECLKSILIQLSKGNFRMGTFERIKVLDDVSFSVFPGEFVSIMGRNGAGKSTLLKIIGGVIQPTTGSVSVNGDIAPLYDLGTGFNTELSGYENIFLYSAIIGRSYKQTLAKVEQIVDFSELGDFIYMPMKQYSSGMKSRLAFSIASNVDAPILICDEVLSAGDHGFAQKCLRRIEKLQNSGRTIFFVGHNAEQIRNYSSRVIVLNNHRIIYDGEAKEGTDLYRKISREKQVLSNPNRFYNANLPAIRTA